MITEISAARGCAARARATSRTARTIVFTLWLCRLGLPVEGDERSRLDLSIIGTHIELDAAGFPKRLEGMVFFRGGARHGGVAGTYAETLRLTIDPELGLVGATGEAVFHLIRRDGKTLSREKIVTRNRSTVVGEIPRDGTLLVESTGHIVEPGSGPAGRLRSSATVKLGQDFELDVSVSLVYATDAEDVRHAARDDAPVGSSFVATITPDGQTRVLYSREFKRSVLRRLTGPNALQPAALSSEVGLSEAMLSRWAQQALALAHLRRIRSALNPPRRVWSFEEKLAIVLKTAAYTERELEDFLLQEELARDELARWRHAIEMVLGGAPSSEPEERAQASSYQAELHELGRKVEALLNDAPLPDDSSDSKPGRESSRPAQPKTDSSDGEDPDGER